jgi:hypothetical protein
MDPNRLTEANASAEQMLVLSAVFLAAVALLIVSHWLGARHGSRLPKSVETSTSATTERALVGAAPLPSTPAAAPSAVSRTVAATAPNRV